MLVAGWRKQRAPASQVTNQSALGIASEPSCFSVFSISSTSKSITLQMMLPPGGVVGVAPPPGLLNENKPRQTSQVRVVGNVINMSDSSARPQSIPIMKEHVLKPFCFRLTPPPHTLVCFIFVFVFFLFVSLTQNLYALPEMPWVLSTQCDKKISYFFSVM